MHKYCWTSNFAFSKKLRHALIPTGKFANELIVFFSSGCWELNTSRAPSSPSWTHIASVRRVGSSHCWQKSPRIERPSSAPSLTSFQTIPSSTSRHPTWPGAGSTGSWTSGGIACRSVRWTDEAETDHNPSTRLPWPEVYLPSTRWIIYFLWMNHSVFTKQTKNITCCM